MGRDRPGIRTPSDKSPLPWVGQLTEYRPDRKPSLREVGTGVPEGDTVRLYLPAGSRIGLAGRARRRSRPRHTHSIPCSTTVLMPPVAPRVSRAVQPAVAALPLQRQDLLGKPGR